MQRSMAATNFGGPLILLLLALLLRSKLHEVQQSITESTTHHKRNFRGFELGSTEIIEQLNVMVALCGLI